MNDKIDIVLLNFHHSTFSAFYYHDTSFLLLEIVVSHNKNHAICRMELEVQMSVLTYTINTKEVYSTLSKIIWWYLFFVKMASPLIKDHTFLLKWTKLSKNLPKIMKNHPKLILLENILSASVAVNSN